MERALPSWARRAEREGYHCAGSAQGVLFRKDAVKTVTKRNQGGVFCVEVPIEEASFWLTAHEPRKIGAVPFSPTFTCL